MPASRNDAGSGSAARFRTIASQRRLDSGTCHVERLLGLGHLALTLGRSGVLVLALLASGSSAGAARDFSNPIVQENSRGGVGGWAESVSDPPTVEGYASEQSVLPGETVHFHVSSDPAGSYAIEIYRLGWYGGLGARLVGSLEGLAETQQLGSSPTGAAWPTTSELRIPADWVSGYYLARFTGANGGRAATMFVVRAPPARAAPILVQVPVNTWQAYNAWGGKSLYNDNSSGGQRADRVSFERPFAPSSLQPFEWELHLVRFLEREGYDVAYQTDIDTHRDPESLLKHRLVVVAGHGEYWTGPMRDAFERARDAGTNLAFLGANVGYWQVRYENDERTLVGYKSPADPVDDPALRTVLFRVLDRPECQLLGVMHQGGLASGEAPSLDYTAVVPADDPWFSATGLKPGTIVPGVVGPEWDTLPTLPPAGCAKPTLEVLFEYKGPPIGADSVRYVAESGARVFSAGSLRFAWGLDAFTPPTQRQATTPIPALQQFVRNVLADLMRPAPPASMTATPAGEGAFRLHVTGSSDPRVTRTIVLRNGTIVCEASPAEDCLDAGLPGHRTYSYDARTVDQWGESEPRTFGPFTLPNSPPAVRIDGPRRVRRGARATYLARAVDRDGDTLRYSWTLDAHSTKKTSLRCSIVFGSRGRHTIAVTVRDGYRGVTVRRAVVRVV
jgi:hypothetical protein